MEVTASLDLTDGYARPGAYVPVRLKAANRTHATFAELRLSSGGPVDVVTPWRLAPGEAGEKIVPVFFAGADLALSLEFISAGGRPAARIDVVPPAVRPLLPGDALVAAAPGMPEPDETLRKSLCESLGVDSLHVLRLPQEAVAAAAQCGLLDAIVSEAAEDVAVAGWAALVRRTPGAAPPGAFLAPREYTGGVMAAAFPPGVQELVQPEAYRLFGPDVRPARDRQRLWLWLGVFALALLAAGVLLPRGRPVLAATCLVAQATAAVAVIWFWGDVRHAAIHEARIMYARPLQTWAAVEHLVLLESRGGAVARFEEPRPVLGMRLQARRGSGGLGFGTGTVPPLPLPTLAGSEQVFQPLGTLRYGDAAAFETVRPLVLVRTLMMMDEPPCGGVAEQVTPAEMQRLAAGGDVVQSLYVEGDRATDPAGQTRTIEEWSVQWQASADPRLAFAGRSLAWWDRARRLGTGPAILIWRHGPSLPSLVIYASE
ncbi:MAG: hypothetical protein IMZ44_25385 [Planctomycetes bacterium]|nr:hypothetical protein [Planctomycetota bacterium]